MSGPKISVYQLTGRAREIVEGQMRCEAQAMACAGRIKQFIQKEAAVGQQLARAQSVFALMRQRGARDVPDAQELERLLEQYKAVRREVEREMFGQWPGVSLKYEIKEKALQKREKKLAFVRSVLEKTQGVDKEVQRVLALYEDGVKSMEQGILNVLTSDAPQEEAPRALSRQETQRRQQSIAQELSAVVDFGDLGAGEPSQEDALREEKRGVEKRLERLAGEETLDDGLRREVAAALTNLDRIGDTGRLRTFATITVQALERRVEARKAQVAALEEEFAAAREEYKVLCEMAQEAEAAFACTQEGVEQLREETARLRVELVRRAEQAYIAECVDEVMGEMGYELIGTREVVKKRSGKCFRNELFRFDEGTAVNVTYASDGQISMELGGVAREDRVPTQAETRALTQDMESFCAEFAEFERRLREKGVVLGDRIALSPPSAEYAAILNINDYELQEGAQVSEISVADKQRRKAAERRTLRRDE